MFKQACVYLINYEVFLKGKHRVNSSCYDKHKVEKKLAGSLQKPSAFYTTELVNSYFHLFMKMLMLWLQVLQTSMRTLRCCI